VFHGLSTKSVGFAEYFQGLGSKGIGFA